MWRGQIWFSTAMLMALGFLTTFLIGGLDRHLPGQPAAGLLHPRHLLRRGPLPLGGDGAGLRRRWAASTTGARRSPATCSTSASARPSSGSCWSAPTCSPCPSTCWGSTACPGASRSTRNSPQWQTLNDWSSAGAALDRDLDAAVRGQRRLQLEEVPGRRQPVGRPDPRVVHHVAAAAPQLLPAAPDPLGAPDLGLQPPRRTARWATAPTSPTRSRRSRSREGRGEAPARPGPVLRRHVRRLLELEPGERRRRDDVRRHAAGLPARRLLLLVEPADAPAPRGRPARHAGRPAPA